MKGYYVEAKHGKRYTFAFECAKTAFTHSNVPKELVKIVPPSSFFHYNDNFVTVYERESGDVLGLAVLGALPFHKPMGRRIVSIKENPPKLVPTMDLANKIFPRPREGLLYFLDEISKVDCDIPWLETKVANEYLNQGKSGIQIVALSNDSNFTEEGAFLLFDHKGALNVQ